MYINEKNIKNIKTVFNDFNKVNISKASGNGYLITNDGSFIQSFNTQTETEDGKTIIHVIIQSKSLDDVMNQYSFTDKQKKNTKELLSDKYSDLWTSYYMDQILDILLIGNKQMKLGRIHLLERLVKL